MSAELLMIVDDDLESRNSFATTARIANFKTVLATDYLRRPADLVEFARKSRVDGVLCDHKLKEANFANFDGAEGAAELNAAGIPAFLVTLYEPADVDIAIRPFRRRIPCLLHKRPRAALLRETFELTRAETVGKELRKERKPYRASLLVEAVQTQGGRNRIIVSIPQWKTDQTIPILCSSVPADAQGQMVVGGWLLADVNLNAACAEDLYIDAIRVPPKAALAEFHAKANRR